MEPTITEVFGWIVLLAASGVVLYFRAKRQYEEEGC